MKAHSVQYSIVLNPPSFEPPSSAPMQQEPTVASRSEPFSAQRRNPPYSRLANPLPPAHVPGTVALQAYKQLSKDLAKDYPDVYTEAKRWADGELKKLTGQEVDSSSIYLNRFKSGQSGPDTHTQTGWDHLDEEPYRSQTVAQALLSNFGEHDWNPGELDSRAGLYTQGAGLGTKGGYGAHNEFPLAPSKLMHSAWKTDFQGAFTQKMEAFWQKHGKDYRTVAKGQFIALARQQLITCENATPTQRQGMPEEQRLTRDDYRILMKAVSNIPVDEKAPLSLAQLETQTPAKGQVRAHALDINGWGASDIIRFTAQDDGQYLFSNGRRDGIQILYIPGASPAFLRFSSLERMDDWIVEQSRDPEKRKALASHFSLYNRQDGGAFGKYGVDSALEHLGNGGWDNEEGITIDRANISIHGDVFTYIRDQTRQRMSSDADIAIKSNSEVTRDTWLNDISAGVRIAAGLAPLGAPAAIATGIGAVAQATLGTQKALEGDNRAERSDGSSEAFEGVLTTLFSAAAGAGAEVEDSFAPPELEPLSNEISPVLSAGPNIRLERSGAKTINFNGKKYFVARVPDAGDGQHFVLRIPDPEDPTQLVSSGKIARPDESGVWRLRGVKGGNPQVEEVADVTLGDPVGFGSRAIVYTDASDPAYVIKASYPLPAAQRVPAMKLEVKLFNQYYGSDAATFLGNNTDNTISYIRMPNIPGATLEDLLQSPAPLPSGLNDSLLKMLAKLEKSGIAHNDLESRNIHYDAATNTAYPVDFGSAKYVGTDPIRSNDRYNIFNLRHEISGARETLEAMAAKLEQLKA